MPLYMVVMVWVVGTIVFSWIAIRAYFSPLTMKEIFKEGGDVSHTH